MAGEYFGGEESYREEEPQTSYLDSLKSRLHREKVEAAVYGGLCVATAVASAVLLYNGFPGEDVGHLGFASFVGGFGAWKYADDAVDTSRKIGQLEGKAAEE